MGSSSLAGQTLYPINTLGNGWSNSHSKLVLHCQHNCIRCGQLVLIVREVLFNSFLRVIALLNNCLVAKTSRAIFIHPHCLYSDVTATLNQLPVQEIPGPVETKPLWEFDQTLSQCSDLVKGLACETRVVGVYQNKCPCHEGAAQVPGRLFQYSPSVTMV